MSISLSDLNSSKASTSKRRKRKAVVNLAQEYSLENKEQAPVKEVEKLEVKKEELTSRLALDQEQPSINSSLTKHSPSTDSSLAQERLFCGEPSLIDFLCQKKLPKSVMNFIMNSPAHNNIHIIHTDDLRDEFNKSASHLSNIIGRLESQGYILVVGFNTNGTRQIKINSSINS